MKKHNLEKFVNKTVKTALVLERYAKNKTNSEERRTRAFKLAQRIRAAHGVAA